MCRNRLRVCEGTRSRNSVNGRAVCAVMEEINQYGAAPRERSSAVLVTAWVVPRPHNMPRRTLISNYKL